MFLKGMHKWFASIALLAVIASFSGFTNYPSYSQKPQTELLVSNTSTNLVTENSYNFLKYKSQKTTFNQYTSFCFKWFLNTHQNNFSITYNSQKEAFLQFNEHLFLEENLIAQTFTSEPYGNFIK